MQLRTVKQLVTYEHNRYASGVVFGTYQPHYQPHDVFLWPELCIQNLHSKN